MITFGLAVNNSKALWLSMTISEGKIELYNASRNGTGVSVLIPTRNYGNYLPRAIESALSQTVKPVEIIVADDGSTDNTPSIVARYGDRVTYRRFSHRGVYGIRNAMLKEMRGEWFLNLDADDWIDGDFLCRALDLVNKAADPARLAFVYPDIRWFGEKDELVIYPDFDPILLRHGNYVVMSSLIRLDVAREVGFDAAFNDGWGDYDFFLSLVEKGFYGVRLPGGLMHVRVHAASMGGRIRSTYRYIRLAERIIAKHGHTYTRKDALALRQGAYNGTCERLWIDATAAREQGIGLRAASLRLRALWIDLIGAGKGLARCVGVPAVAREIGRDLQVVLAYKRKKISKMSDGR